MNETYNLKEMLEADSVNFKNIMGVGKLKMRVFSDPACDQRYIWKYIKNLRHVEYFTYRSKRNKNLYNQAMRAFYLYKLRKVSYKTGFQIPPFTCGKGLVIYHWGPIIINGNVRIGDNCTLYSGVLIGWKSPNEPGCAKIGNNVFIGSGTKIIGPVHIGNNVIIGQNMVITKDIPDNSVVVSKNEYRYIK